MRMKNMQCQPHTTKSCRFSSTYTPKSALGIQSWRDNIDVVAFNKDTGPNKNLLTTFGLFNEGPPGELFPETGSGTTLTPAHGKTITPNFKIEILVNYKIAMIRRNNVYDNNAAREHVLPPHTGEL